MPCPWWRRVLTFSMAIRTLNGLQTPRNICSRYRSRHVADTPSASFQYHARCSKVWSRKNDTLMFVNEVSIVSQEYMDAVPG